MNGYILKNGIIYNADFSTDQYDTSTYTIGDEYHAEATQIISTDARLYLVDKSTYANADGDLSIEETYNQLILTCDCDEVEDVLSSPFEEEDIYSPFSTYQHYCDEIICWGEGHTANQAFRDICHGKTTDYDACEIRKWYIQQMKNKKWTFNLDYQIPDTDTWQWRNALSLYSKGCLNGCSLLKLGNVVQKPTTNDNAIKNDFGFENYICFSILGETDKDNPFPQLEDMRSAYSHFGDQVAMKYNDSVTSCRYSPIDSTTHHYFVFTGKVYLQKRTRVTKPWHSMTQQESEKGIWHATVDLTTDTNAYYTVKYYQNNSPYDKEDTVLDADYGMIIPYNTDNDGLIDCQYNDSEGDIDRIMYLPILCCRMCINDYYLLQKYESNEDFPTYYWCHKDNLPVAHTDETTGEKIYEDTFTIGINPAYEDYLVGKEYSIANNISSDWGIQDTEGLAIDIPYDLNLTGKINFEILGPAWVTYDNELGLACYDKEWDEYPYSGPGVVSDTFHNRWVYVKKYKSLYCYCDALWLKEFECKIISDNGGYLTSDANDSDLVYQTEEDPDSTYLNKKDDLTFKISTLLTATEALEKGIANTIKQNNPSVVSDNSALRSLYNCVTGETAKAEELYLKHYYNEYSSPKILFNVSFKDTPERSWTSHYTFDEETHKNWTDKTFFVQSMSYNVKYCRQQLTLKEI